MLVSAWLLPPAAVEDTGTQLQLIVNYIKLWFNKVTGACAVDFFL